MQKSILRIAIGTGLILLIPLFANLFMGWNWPAFAFPAWGAILFGAGLTYDLIAKQGGTIAYRVAVGLACATGFVLVFINAAAGIIGDGPVNLLYLAVLGVGFVGAFIARFQPRGMARALVATAVAQALVPLIAQIFWRHDFAPGVVPVLGLNAVFVALWGVSALLFWLAAAPSSKIQGEVRGRGTSREGIAN